MADPLVPGDLNVLPEAPVSTEVPVSLDAATVASGKVRGEIGANLSANSMRRYVEDGVPGNDASADRAIAAMMDRSLLDF